MIKRQISEKLIKIASKFPVIAVLGPRQSGKTTLVRNLFPWIEYRNLEEPDVREFAKNDPRTFLASGKKPFIIDEIQRVPELLSYIQSFVDESSFFPHYVITGSQNILLQENISQSLAGRVSLNTLLPFSLSELAASSGLEELSSAGYIFRGFYPPVIDREIHPDNWYPDYIATYIERDVRLIKNISDLSAFTKFLRLCAARVGHQLNLTSLATDCGISVNTAKTWLSVLVQSYIVFLVEPFFTNTGKRLVKMPKLYFYDTGLAVSLIGINTEDMVEGYYQYGFLFENFVIADIMKTSNSISPQRKCSFLRDEKQHEIDLIIEDGLKKTFIEIKSSGTFAAAFLKGFEYYTHTGIIQDTDRRIILFNGDTVQQRGNVNVLPYRQFLVSSES